MPAREQESTRSTAETGTPKGGEGSGERSRPQTMDTAEGWAHDAVRFTGAVAEGGVHLVRDVATDAVQAVGDVGNEVVRQASNLLVGLVDGLRGVADSVTRRQPPPPPPPA